MFYVEPRGGLTKTPAKRRIFFTLRSSPSPLALPGLPDVFAQAESKTQTATSAHPHYFFKGTKLLGIGGKSAIEFTGTLATRHSFLAVDENTNA